MTVRIGNNIIAGNEVATSIHNTNTGSESPRIFNWIGTTAEYNALGSYDPDWLYYITDDYMTGGTAGGRSIGDIFYSMRTDTNLAGAVRCNGNTYYISDFTGSESIGNLFLNGKLPYVSLAEYAEEVTTTGVCGKFGWDGSNTTEFRVPTLNDIFIEASNSINGEFVEAGLPNITGDAGVGRTAGDSWQITESQGAFFNSQTHLGLTDTAGSRANSSALGFDASRSSSIYGNSTTVQPKSVKYSAFVQISIDATDEATETCTSVLADVSTLKGYDYVIDWQMPTVDNNYTWYRKYKSGWVEQGGFSSGTFSGNKVFAYPITMADTNYTLTTGAGCPNVNGMHGKDYITARTTTNFTYYNVSIDGNFKNNNFSWQVSGMTA